MWGVASSAWQVEAALQSEGRGPSQSDLNGDLPQPATGCPNDSLVMDLQYYLYKHDIARIAANWIHYYYFTISWTLIVPLGDVGSPVNQPGLDHYDHFINTCPSYGVTPSSRSPMETSFCISNSMLQHFQTPSSTKPSRS